MSIAQLGNKKTLGRKQSLSEISKRVAKTKGKKRTAEQNKRSSISHIGYITPEETKIKLRIALKGVNSKKVINTLNGEIFENTKIASQKTGIILSTLRAQLNGQNKNKTTYKYFINE